MEIVYAKKIVFNFTTQKVMIFENDKINGYDAVFGKHAVWIPARCLKIIWSWRGKICSRIDWDKGNDAEEIASGNWGSEEDWSEDSLASITNEIDIMNLLSFHNMAPKIGKLFHFEQSISTFPFGSAQCDNMGIFGYEIEDANHLPRGEFEVQKFRLRFVETGMIEASEGALGDVAKPNNCVNGYLIDVRRTGWDMMRLNVSVSTIDLNLPTTEEELKQKISKLTQFPYGARKQNYQSYFLGDADYQEGSRDTVSRLKLMGIDNKYAFFDQSVLDIGCNLGAICLESFVRGAKYVVGVDNENDYIECARDLAKHNGYPINYMVLDLSDSKNAVKYFNNIFPMGIDIIFALSIYKHIGNSLWEILAQTNWKTAYIESHNAPKGEETDHVKEMIIGMDSLGCKRTYLGTTTDRSPRLVWRLDR